MTGTDHLITEAAERLFRDFCTRDALDAAEAGIWPDALWAAIEESGFTTALAVGQPDETADLTSAAEILKSAGRFAAPVPVAEAMLAGWVLTGCGLEVPQGPLVFAPVRTSDEIRLVRHGDEVRLAGMVPRVPWASRASRIVVLAQADDGWFVAVVDPARCQVQAGRNYAGEPRDSVTFVDVHLAQGEVAPIGPAWSPERIHLLGALLRSAMMTGALERVLDLSIQYAQERTQFGRPLARFQVIQQNLAVLAGEVAAAGMATSAAVAAMAAHDPGFAAAAAKIRVGEAAGKVAAIAHQVHGAIGFTHEHALHHLTRRLWSWRDEFGTESEWAMVLGAGVAQAGAERLWPQMTSSWA